MVKKPPITSPDFAPMPDQGQKGKLEPHDPAKETQNIKPLGDGSDDKDADPLLFQSEGSEAGEIDLDALLGNIDDTSAGEDPNDKPPVPDMDEEVCAADDETASIRLADGSAISFKGTKTIEW